MATSSYWLARWLDENDLRTTDDARRYLRDQAHVEALRSAAATATRLTEIFRASNEHGILAGRIIDLSGELACYHADCLRKDVDTLFSRVWHYFDTIVVVGLSPKSALGLLEEWDEESTERFLAFVQTFLYIRKVGAENMLVFQGKPPACTEHVRDHAREYGATSVLKQRKQWTERISADAQIGNLRRHGDHWHYDMWHPDMEHLHSGSVRSKNKKPTRKEILKGAFDDYASKLISDIGAARSARLPLGTAAAMHEDVLTRSHPSAPSVEDALFRLELPVIDGVPTRELIAIRNENGQYFDAFQLALKNAANDLIANAADEATPESIARQIESDVIEPELIQIRRKLRVAADSLTIKSAVGFPVGALGTIVGLLDKLPAAATVLASTVAVGGLAALLTDYKKYVDDKSGVRMYDMYFLWEAERVAAKRRSGQS